MADSFMAAVGEPDIKGKLKKGHKAGNKTFKVHLDGYNQLPYLTGKEEKGSRKEFFYFSDDAELIGLRYNDWKAVFMEQRAHRFDVWRDPFVVLRAPKLFNLRRDSFERADTDSNMYNRWWCEHAFVFIPAQAISLQFANTFRAFPPRQGAAKFNVEATMDILKELTPATSN